MFGPKAESLMTKKESPAEMVTIEFAPSRVMLDFVNMFLNNMLKSVGVHEDDRKHLVAGTGDVAEHILREGYGGDHRQGNISFDLEIFTDRVSLVITDTAPGYSISADVSSWTVEADNKTPGYFVLESRKRKKSNWCRLSGSVGITVPEPETQEA